MQTGTGFPAPAKLNLFLHVIGRRPDGYHLLQSVFTLIDRCDEVRLRVREDGLVRRVGDLPGVPESEDLAVRAALLLKEASGSPKGVDIEVEKIAGLIPSKVDAKAEYREHALRKRR